MRWAAAAAPCHCRWGPEVAAGHLRPPAGHPLEAHISRTLFHPPALCIALPLPAFSLKDHRASFAPCLFLPSVMNLRGPLGRELVRQSQKAAHIAVWRRYWLRSWGYRCRCQRRRRLSWCRGCLRRALPYRGRLSLDWRLDGGRCAHGRRSCAGPPNALVEALHGALLLAPPHHLHTCKHLTVDAQMQLSVLFWASMAPHSRCTRARHRLYICRANASLPQAVSNHCHQPRPGVDVALMGSKGGRALSSRMRWKSAGDPEGMRVKRLSTRFSGRLPTTLSSASALPISRAT